MQTNFINIVKQALPNDTVAMKGKDILVNSKDRIASKERLEKYLKQKNIKFGEKFMPSKSSSMNVLTFPDTNLVIIFKPIRAKGQGGLDFEAELKLDLVNYFNGVTIPELKHKDAVKELEHVLKLNQRGNYSVVHEGSKNQKRSLSFSSGKLSISNSTGATLTDITLKSANKLYYLSLKKSKTYYILSGSIFNIFLNHSTQVPLCEYLGLDGTKMGGFGTAYACVTKEPNYTKVNSNLCELLAEAYGYEMVLVHKKNEGNVLVSEVKQKASITISDLNDKSYIYPVAGTRKYAGITFSASINGHRYKVVFQFRGTTATDVGPKYLRILMERL